jgi:ATP-dependent Zn protease
MIFPTLVEIFRADVTQLEEWYRCLRPATDAQKRIFASVVEQCQNMNVFTPDYKRRCRRATAVHEAGHGVVAEKLGFRVLQLAITSDEGGYCQHEPSPEPVSDDQLKNEIIVLHAGKWAELQCALSSFRITCSTIDDENAKQLESRLYADKPFSSKEYLRQEIDESVVELVRTNRDGIIRVAESLLEDETLTGPQLQEILKTSP